jgi:hypothetical protein
MPDGGGFGCAAPTDDFVSRLNFGAHFLEFIMVTMGTSEVMSGWDDKGRYEVRVGEKSIFASDPADAYRILSYTLAVKTMSHTPAEFAGLAADVLEVDDQKRKEMVELLVSTNGGAGETLDASRRSKLLLTLREYLSRVGETRGDLDSILHFAQGIEGLEDITVQDLVRSLGDLWEAPRVEESWADAGLGNLADSPPNQIQGISVLNKGDD